VSDIKNEIIRASKLLQVNISEIPQPEYQLIIEKVVNKYTSGKHYPLPTKYCLT
jgi:hypothetical protein